MTRIEGQMAAERIRFHIWSVFSPFMIRFRRLIFTAGDHYAYLDDYVYPHISCERDRFLEN